MSGKAKKIKVTVTASLSGQFKLPYGPGHEIEVSANLAKEIIDSGRGVYSDAKKAADKVEGAANKEETTEE
jgi:hypothetical protein